ncbi:MAG: adenine-specific methyltransferase EcoRI family protein [Proteobacteria bacterium]|nr:adenine-specific methyltransferase EcoRI family protein [Pseudomonadota bacterium]
MSKIIPPPPPNRQKNANLNKAKAAKKDEFFTQITSIEKELRHYKNRFKGKVVFCNCDDPETSNFWLYFFLNFGELGLKKLIATHFSYEEKPTYKLEYDDTLGKVQTPLKGNGDFRSEECIALLNEADIVCTNPPFSLFREYVAQLMHYRKKFLIIGNLNGAKYKETFPLVKEKKMWFGASGMGMEFRLHPDYPLTSATGRVDDEGNKYVVMPTAVWLTNMKHPRREKEKIRLYESYDPAKYPTYDNYNAIEVSKVKEIPVDYMGEMGVPISFLTKHNPSQFEIVGLCRYLPKTRVMRGPQDCMFLNGSEKYSRIVIKRVK